MTPPPDTTARTETAETVTVPRVPTQEMQRAAVEAIHAFATDADRGFHGFHGSWGDEAMRVYSERFAVGYRAALAAAPALASPQHPVGVREADLEAIIERYAAPIDGRSVRNMPMEVVRQHLREFLHDATATLAHPPAQDAPGADWRETERNDYISDAKAFEMFGDEDDNQALADRIRVCDGEWVRIPGGYYFDKSAGPLHPEVTSEACDHCAVSIDPSPPLPEADGEVVAWLEKRRYPEYGSGWQSMIVANNPEYVEKNGPDNFEPLVRQSALVSALRERDKWQERAADRNDECDRRAQKQWDAEAACEKAEQVAAGLREELAERLDVIADEQDVLALRDGLEDWEVFQCRYAETLFRREADALRASTEEGKTATPSVTDEEAGR